LNAAAAVKLASNENPLGPSPLAVAAARKALANANRYPDADGLALRQALSKKHDLRIEQIMLGEGSTELIDLSARLMLRPGNTGLTSFGSFPLYYLAIRAAGARLVETPLRDYAFDLGAIARSLTPEARIVFLANPNNPTGTMFTADAFDDFFARVPPHVLVVLDEAYYEYVAERNEKDKTKAFIAETQSPQRTDGERTDYSRSVELVRRGANLLVLRTFSKVYGLAGLRIAYGLGPAKLLEQMNALRGPFNTSNVAQAAALAALRDREHVRRSVESNVAGLTQLAAGLKHFGVRAIPSVGNFILAEFGYDTEPLCGELAQRGVIVRPMRWMGFPQAIRISVGTRAENEKFLSALANLRVPSAVGASKKQGSPRVKLKRTGKARNNSK
jgi:histidinol-phosphate aminotransferase